MPIQFARSLAPLVHLHSPPQVAEMADMALVAV